MTASYPASVKSFTTKVDFADTVLAEHVNSLQEEVNSIHLENYKDEDAILRETEELEGDELLEKIEITKDELRDYADLDLGKQIRDCIVKTGSCSFEAEL